MNERDQLRRIRGTSPDVSLAARTLRRQATPADQALWAALRNRGVAGLEFRRQQPLGELILDFCCPDRGIVVEIDGHGHDEPEQQPRDHARTEHLQSLGWRVLRFSNDQIDNDLPAVIQAIATAAGRS